MKVHELIKLLKKQPQDHEVKMRKYVYGDLEIEPVETVELTNWRVKSENYVLLS